MSLAAVFASVVAILVAAGTSGWSAVFLLAVEAGRGVYVVIALVSIGFGAVAYYLTHRFVSSRITPLGVLARDLRNAALRPRDHISALDELVSRIPESHAAEVRGVVGSLRLLLERIDQRHERQMAWSGAVAHDLKTPIAACANVLQVLRDESAAGRSVDAARLDEVVSELRSLTFAFQRMIDTVRFEREDVRVERRLLDLQAIMKRIVIRYEDRCDLTLAGVGDSSCMGDAELIERALDNLVANAVRYARSSVRVEVFPCMVRVADDGHGLPAPLDHLAQPFRSQAMLVDGVRVPGGAGGIGLFVARRVLEVHGGRLVVEATSERGTTVLAYIGSGRDG